MHALFRSWGARFPGFSRARCGLAAVCSSCCLQALAPDGMSKPPNSAKKSIQGYNAALPKHPNKRALRSFGLQRL